MGRGPDRSSHRVAIVPGTSGSPFYATAKSPLWRCRITKIIAREEMKARGEVARPPRERGGQARPRPPVEPDPKLR